MTDTPLLKRVQPFLKGVRRIVVKVGTALLSHPRTHFNSVVVHQLGDEIAALKQSGLEVILISSGSVGLGMSVLGIEEYPKDLTARQALAAVGQGMLMARYSDVFAPYGVHVAQVLLTRRDLEERSTYLNARNAIQRLLQSEVLPIINQNDATATEELAFSDNDKLAALVTGKMDAQALVLLTTVDGLHRDWSNPASKGELVPVVEVGDEDLLCHARGPEAGVSLGGMATKIEAACSVASFGTLAVIANGRRPGVLRDLLSGGGRGTYILPSGPRLKGRKHWIAYGKRATGVVVVDTGARRAVEERGKSLLPSGVVGVAGVFHRGDLVEIHDEDGQEFARGLVSYAADELERVTGMGTAAVSSIIGHTCPKEAIHRDNLVLL